MKSKRLITVISILSLLIPASIWYGQHHGLLPVSAGEEADLYDGLFGNILAIAFGMFLLIEGLLIYVMVRFRHRAGDDEDGPAIHDNALLELTWTAIPTVMVLWVALASFDTYDSMRHAQAGASTPFAHDHSSMLHVAADHAKSKASPKTLAVSATENVAAPLEIDVSAMQFAWLFSYPGTDVVTAELHVPIGQTVKLNITAQDVIHSFWVPQLRIKQDAVPGLPTNLEFTPSRPGEYPIVCAELCGSYHGGMRAQMIVQTPEEYANWLKQEGEVASNKSTPTLAVQGGQFLASHVDRLGVDRELLARLHQP